MGEAIAAAFLERRGAEILGRNVDVGRGEIDLVVRERGVVVAVEVKTVGLESTGAEPIDRIDDRKLRQVRRLAADRMIGRVDFVGVRLEPHGALVNWRTAVA